MPACLSVYVCMQSMPACRRFDLIVECGTVERTVEYLVVNSTDHTFTHHKRYRFFVPGVSPACMCTLAASCPSCCRGRSSSFEWRGGHMQYWPEKRAEGLGIASA